MCWFKFLYCDGIQYCPVQNEGTFAIVFIEATELTICASGSLLPQPNNTNNNSTPSLASDAHPLSRSLQTPPNPYAPAPTHATHTYTPCEGTRIACLGTEYLLLNQQRLLTNLDEATSEPACYPCYDHLQTKTSQV